MSRKTAIQAIAAFWDEVVSQAETLSIDELVVRDEEFHLKIAALGCNLKRVRLLEHVNARIQFVRRVNLESNTRSRAGFAEHHQLLQHLLEGDQEAAEDLIRRHLTLNVDQAMEAIRLGLVRIYAETVT